MSALEGTLGLDPATLFLIVAAHPDDETLGASWLLASHPNVVVVHATDGAPRDPRLWSPRASGFREDYARLRAQECRRALSIAGVPVDRRRSLGLVDQEAVDALVPFARALDALFEELGPTAVVSQPYEGGHPDHDACAFAVSAALALHRARTGRAPLALEMTSYHRWQGRLRTGEFLRGEPHETTHRLTPEERQLKRRMLDCYESQAEVLAAFDTTVERYRPTPRYDFTKPPHPGLRHYESLGWPMRAKRWCELGARASEELGLSTPIVDEDPLAKETRCD